MVVVRGQRQLPQLIRALNPAGSLARRLDGRQQKCDQNANECADDKQLNHCKSHTTAVGGSGGDRTVINHA
jgi:hypothetical protein